MKLMWITISLLAIFTSSNGYKILVSCPGLAASQNLIMYRFADLLGAAGHEVTIWNPTILDAKKPKIPHVKREISFQAVKDKEAQNMIKSMMSTMAWTPGASNLGSVEFVSRIYRIYKDGVLAICESVATDRERIEEFKKEKFDVIILNLIDFCTYGMAHLIDVEATIGMSAAFMVDFMAYYGGSPYPVSYCNLPTNSTG